MIVITESVLVFCFYIFRFLPIVGAIISQKYCTWFPDNVKKLDSPIAMSSPQQPSGSAAQFCHRLLFHCFCCSTVCSFSMMVIQYAIKIIKQSISNGLNCKKITLCFVMQKIKSNFLDCTIFYSLRDRLKVKQINGYNLLKVFEITLSF